MIFFHHYISAILCSANTVHFLLLSRALLPNLEDASSQAIPVLTMALMGCVLASDSHLDNGVDGALVCPSAQLGSRRHQCWHLSSFQFYLVSNATNRVLVANLAW
jgi:hypothetical protein